MRTIFAAIVPLLLCAAQASGQSPLTPATGKTIDLGLGYSYMSQGESLSGPIRLNGGQHYDWLFQPGAELTNRVSDSIAIRLGVDYMRTSYFDSTIAVRGQSNIRSTVTILYSFVKRSRERRLS